MPTENGTPITFALLPIAVVLFTCCSSEPKPEGTEQAAAQTGQAAGEGAVLTAFKPGVPGGVLVGTYRETATVTGIDKEKRKLTLVTPDGAMGIFKAGPDVVNFDQIQMGDQVKAVVTQELAIFVRKNGDASTTTAAATTVALAPVGAKPGALIADTVEVTAKVTAIDLKQHKATLQFPDGTSKTFKVRPDVDLTTQSVGQEVVIRTTDALAVSIEKP